MASPLTRPEGHRMQALYHKVSQRPLEQQAVTLCPRPQAQIQGTSSHSVLTDEDKGPLAASFTRWALWLPQPQWKLQRAATVLQVGRPICSVHD